MKTFQQILATILLALAIGIPTYAGDMGGPSSVCSPTPLPTDDVTLVVETSSPTVTGDSESPALMMLALNFVVGALSAY